MLSRVEHENSFITSGPGLGERDEMQGASAQSSL